MSKDKPQGTTPVELVVDSYGWNCLDCDTYNKEEYADGIVTCTRCGKSFHALLPEVSFDT